MMDPNGVRDAVRATDVWFGYGREPVLRGVSFGVRVGSFTALIGPNGAGKSTLLRILLGLLQPDRGAIDALVNNAGYGVTGQYVRHDWSTHEQFLHVMTVSVAALTHRLLPPMVSRGFGRVLNISSLAAFVPPSAGHTLYGASKAFLLRFSASLGLEVARHGVHVTALCPGFTYSEFHDISGMRARVSRMPGFLWMDAARVAREGYDAVEAGRLVHIPGRVNRAIAAGARFLPDSVVHLVNARAGRAYRDAT